MSSVEKDDLKCRLLTSISTPIDPLSPELIESFQRWLLRASKPSTIPISFSNGLLQGDTPADLLFSLYLEDLVILEEQQRGPPSAVARAKDAAFGFFSRLSTKTNGILSTLYVSEFSDIRLSHVIAHFGPQHISGDRVPSASAAASRPPPSFVSKSEGGIKVPTAALQFATANGGIWPLMPCKASIDNSLIMDKVACGIIQKEGEGEERGISEKIMDRIEETKQTTSHIHHHQHHHQHRVLSNTHFESPTQLQPLTLCPVHTPLTTVVALSNMGRSKAIVSLRPLQSIGEDGSYVLSVEPSTVSLKKGESIQIHISLRVLRPNHIVNAFVVVETTTPSVLNSNGRRMLLLVRAHSEQTYFGVRLSDVPTVRSGGYDSIPLPLAQLRDALLGGNDGGLSMLQAEGLFRVAPSADEKNAIRQALDNGTFSDTINESPTSLVALNTNPINATGHTRGPLSPQQQLYYAKKSPIAVAHMIKVFLRELPSPLFSAIPTETLLRAASEEDCIALIGWLTPPASYIFAWLVDLLVEVARHEAHNKMGLKNLAICTGPNLFSTDENVNPMEALMTSQKSVSALFQIISARSHQTEAASKGEVRDFFAEILGVSARPVQTQLVHNELKHKSSTPTQTRLSINALKREM